MKSRIVILLSVILVALVLVMGAAPNVMPTSPVVEASPEDGYYKYVVPFVCGTATSDEVGVKPGNYATTINIYNPNCDVIPRFWWRVTRLYPSLMESAWLNVDDTGPNRGKTIRCKQILKQLGLDWPPEKYMTGYVIVQCYDCPLVVNGVHTVETDTGVSIDVECVYPADYFCLQ